jgi:hypothetical protein
VISRGTIDVASSSTLFRLSRVDVELTVDTLLAIRSVRDFCPEVARLDIRFRGSSRVKLARLREEYGPILLLIAANGQGHDEYLRQRATSLISPSRSTLEA